MPVFATGPTGFVATAAVRALPANGPAAIGFARSDAAAGGWQPEPLKVLQDLVDADYFTAWRPAW